MPKPFRAVLLSALLIVSLTAASGSESFDVRILFATMGLALTGAAAKHMWTRDRQVEKWQGLVDVALWGPADVTGRRNLELGVVAGVARVDAKVDAIGEKMEAVVAAAEIVKAFAADNADTMEERRRARDSR